MSTVLEPTKTTDPLEEIPTLPEEPVKHPELLRAAELIERDGWCSYQLVNLAGQRCIRGAIRDAMGLTNDWHNEGFFVFEGGIGGYEADTAVYWNNALPPGSDNIVATALRRLAKGATWTEAIR